MFILHDSDKYNYEKCLFINIIFSSNKIREC